MISITVSFKMHLAILGLVSFAVIANSYVIQLPGQCQPDSAFKLDTVIFDPKAAVGEFYTILVTNNGPYAGLASKRTIEVNPDSSICVTETYYTYSDRKIRIQFNATAIPNSHAFEVKRTVDDDDQVYSYKAYVLHSSDDKDTYIAYACRNDGSDYKEEELAVWSRNKSRVDEEILADVQAVVEANNLYDAYNFLQIVQQPCCQIDSGYCPA